MVFSTSIQLRLCDAGCMTLSLGLAAFMHSLMMASVCLIYELLRIRIEIEHTRMAESHRALRLPTKKATERQRVSMHSTSSPTKTRKDATFVHTAFGVAPDAWLVVVENTWLAVPVFSFATALSLFLSTEAEPCTRSGKYMLITLESLITFSASASRASLIMSTSQSFRASLSKDRSLSTHYPAPTHFDICLVEISRHCLRTHPSRTRWPRTVLQMVSDHPRRMLSLNPLEKSGGDPVPNLQHQQRLPSCNAWLQPGEGSLSPTDMLELLV